MRQPVARDRLFRIAVSVVLLTLPSTPTLASPGLEPGGPVNVYLPIVLKQAISDEPGDPGRSDDELPGFEFALDPDGQPVKMMGVDGSGSDEIVQVIVQLADAPLTTYQGSVLGLPATKPLEGELLDIESSSAKTYATYLGERRAEFGTHLHSTTPGTVLVHEFDGVVIQGTAVSLRRDQIASLERLPGVTQVMLVREHRPLLEFSLPLIGVPRLWNQLGGPGSAGTGQRIAIIDTGIDIESPFFDDAGFSAPSGFPRGDADFTNDKIIVARAYFTGDENPCGPGNPITPLDFHGHGTHVAAIAAGNYDTPAPGTMYDRTLSGVAPRAFLMSYNVFPCGSDGASDVDIIAAIEDAVADEADVVNMSLGNPFVGRIEDDLLVQAVENAVAAHVVFSIPAGNEGSAAETVGSPGVSPNAITVGASTTEARPGHTINVTSPAPVSPGLLDIFALEGTGPSLTSDLVAPYTSVGQAFGYYTACYTITGSLAGQVALIKRGDCPLADKVRNAANAGAIAAVVYNHLPGAGSFVMPGLESATIPSFMVANWAGLNLEDRYTDHPSAAEMEIEASLSWSGRLPDAVASFSARGPNPDWAIKPDIVAPGVDILSATQDDYLPGCCTDSSGCARLSGTSLSAAHVAGAAALVKQLWPGLSVNSTKSILMTAAKMPVWQHDGFAPPPARAMDRGAGRIDISFGSADGQVRIDPPSYGFGSRNVGNNGPIDIQQAFTVRAGSTNRTWALTVVQTPGHPNLQLTVTPSTLHVRSSQTFALRVQADTSVPPGEYEGFVRLSSGTQALHVPYWIRIVNVSVPLGDILLVDDDRNSEDWTAASPMDCSARYISTLDNLGHGFAYWDTLENGTPTQADMERASTVIWFTCRDFRSSLNFLTPIESTEATELQNYLEAGGRLFITGQEIAHGSAPSTVAGLGARLCYKSVFEGGTLPKPSVGGARSTSVEPIAGGMEFDIVRYTDGREGNGTGFPFFVDELGLSGNQALPILFALSPNNARCQGIVGVKNASEPTLEAPQEYPGRSVYLSFDFDDINNNRGYDTREELMQNILDWLTDEASVVARCAVDGRTVDCVATPSSSVGATPAEFRWDLGDGVVLSSGSSPSVVHNYNTAGTFTIRVEATDNWGHKALDDFIVAVQ